MKKTIVTSVIASIMLLVSSASFAEITNNANGRTSAASTGNSLPNDVFNVSFNSSSQMLHINQTAGNNAVHVTVTNDHGNVIYNGSMLNGNSNINMSGATTGKYNIQLQDGTDDTHYKLLIL